MSAHDPSAPVGASLLSLSFHRLMRTPRAVHRAIATRASVFKLGRNACALAQADKASFLVDADQFYRSFAEAAIQAESQIVIVGWDTDTRTELPLPKLGDSPFEWPDAWTIAGRVSLGDLLQFLVEKKPNLCVSVLSWDFAFIYLLERERFPSLKYSHMNQRSERIRFVLDQQHPTLASHHQKVVVIDDHLAFSGGLDLTQRRWDTPEHKGLDPRRTDPDGHLYGPFHDVQICVQGEAAQKLGDLVRERWQLATGESLSVPAKPGIRRIWPESARVDLSSVEVAIARTLPYSHRQRDPKKKRPTNEVEKLFLDAIRSAQKFVYIENQYFTSLVIAKAIAKRLREPNGPEFIMVLPRDQTGWIEEATMGLLRSRALRLIEGADLFGRFSAFYPVVPSLGEGYVKVHSKVMIVDDQFVRIGSANLNNRSMGMDTECDLAIEAHGRLDVVASIARLRRELLGEHLGVEPAEFDARFLMNGSLTDTVDSFCGGQRTLVPLRATVPEWVGRLVPPGSWIDPTSPMGIRRWFAKKLKSKPLATCALFICLAVLIFAIEHFGVGQNSHGSQFMSLLDPSHFAERIQSIRDRAWAVPAVLLGMVAATILLVPITVLFLALAIVYSPEEALILSLCGGVLASSVQYALGRHWSYTKSRILNRPVVQRISKQLNRGGILGMTAIRMTPVAPFAVVSLVAGGLHVRFRDYLIGTFLGLLPGTIVIALVSRGAHSAWAVADSARLNFFVISAAILAILVMAVLPRVFLKSRASKVDRKHV